MPLLAARRRSAYPTLVGSTSLGSRVPADLPLRLSASAGLAYLKGLTQLVFLALDNTQVTDVGLEHLQGLSGLQQLNLSSTKVTDTGLKHLQGLTQLRRLDLTSTKVTDAGVAQLKKALPSINIHR
jgi:Leucine-rich repeat (LRR) protein